MTPSSESGFKQNYQTHLQHLKLKGLQPKTIKAYSRAIFSPIEKIKNTEKKIKKRKENKEKKIENKDTHQLIDILTESG